MDWAREQPDVSVWHTKASYRDSRFGMLWVNDLLRRHGRKRWCVVVDPDEFLVYPMMETRSLRALAQFLEDDHRPCLHALLVDAYSDRPLAETQLGEGDDPFAVCPFFDRDGYMQQESWGNSTWVQGGPRMRAHFADRPEQAPALNKIPFVRWKRLYHYNMSTHDAWPRRLNRAHAQNEVSTTGALFHFKLVAGLAAKAAEEAERGEHYAAGREYARYREGGGRVLRRGPERPLRGQRPAGRARADEPGPLVLSAGSAGLRPAVVDRVGREGQHPGVGGDEAGAVRAARRHDHPVDRVAGAEAVERRPRPTRIAGVSGASRTPAGRPAARRPRAAGRRGRGSRGASSPSGRSPRPRSARRAPRRRPAPPRSASRTPSRGARPAASQRMAQVSSRTALTGRPVPGVPVGIRRLGQVEAGSRRIRSRADAEQRPDRRGRPARSSGSELAPPPCRAGSGARGAGARSRDSRRGWPSGPRAGRAADRASALLRNRTCYQDHIVCNRWNGKDDVVLMNRGRIKADARELRAREARDSGAAPPRGGGSSRRRGARSPGRPAQGIGAISPAATRSAGAR